MVYLACSTGNLTSTRYWAVLQKLEVDAGEDAGELWFQQDGTTAHTARESTDWQPYFLSAVHVWWPCLAIQVSWHLCPRLIPLGTLKSQSEREKRRGCGKLCLLSDNDHRNVLHDRDTTYNKQLLKNKHHILNGILLLILHNLCAPCIQTYSPTQQYDNSHNLLLYPLPAVNQIRPNQLYTHKIGPLNLLVSRISR